MSSLLYNVYASQFPRTEDKKSEGSRAVFLIFDGDQKVREKSTFLLHLGPERVSHPSELFLVFIYVIYKYVKNNLRGAYKGIAIFCR